MTASSSPSSLLGLKPKLWVPGDWNAFFGFGTNILVNLLTLSGLLRFVLQMPNEMVFGRILPAAGMMMCMSTFYYAWLAYRLAQKTGRSDVCALPSGISVPHMFIVTLVIMLPVKLATGDPMKGWQAGLVWVFIQSFVLMGGGFLAPIIRRITPKAALLGALAGVAITFISMKPALEMFMTPMVGVVCFAVILVSWFGGVKYGGVPAGLVAILGAVTVFIIDRDFAKASGFAAAGGLLTFFGLMHGEEVGAFQNPTVVGAYFVVAGVLFVCGRFAVVAKAPASAHEEQEHEAEDKSLDPLTDGEMVTAK
jgi:AGZA family xanthine/uracil permease-like MFS transporter